MKGEPYIIPKSIMGDSPNTRATDVFADWPATWPKDLKSIPAISGGTIYVGPGGLKGCEYEIHEARSAEAVFRGLKAVESKFLRPGEAFLFHGKDVPIPIREFDIKVPLLPTSLNPISRLSVPSIQIACDFDYTIDRKIHAKILSKQRRMAYLRRRLKRMNTLNSQGRLKTPKARRKMVRLITKASRLKGHPLAPSVKVKIERALGLR